MADGSWVEFDRDLVDFRYLVDPHTYCVLQFANEDIINIQLKDLPVTNGAFSGFDMFMSALTVGALVDKICKTFDRELYKGRKPPSRTIVQPSSDQFPSTEWLVDVWTLLSKDGLREEILEPLLGYHLVPVELGFLAPLDKEQRVIHRASTLPNNLDADQVLDFLETCLGCQVVRSGVEDLFSWWSQCFVSVTDAGAILKLLANISSATFAMLTPPQRQLLCAFMSTILSSKEKLSPFQRKSLGQLPVFQGYTSSDLKSFYGLGGQANTVVCRGFSSESRPWELSSVTLLNEDQPMSAHLIHIFQVPTLEESTYWYRLFSEFAETNSDDSSQWNLIMADFFPSFWQHSLDHDFVTLLKDVPFVNVQSKSSMGEGAVPSKKLPPAMVVSSEISQYFFQDEAVFPTGMYREPFNLTVLAKLGMSTHFDAEFAVNRMEQISSMSTDSWDSGAHALRVATDFFARLNLEVNSNFLCRGRFANCVKDLAWVPARVHTDEPFRLYRPDQCRPQTDRLTVGVQMPTSPFVCANTCLSSLMGWEILPPLRAVLGNLLHLSTQCMEGRCPDNFEELIQAIYRDLNGRIQDSQAVSIMKESLASHRCVPINRSLHAIDRVAIKIQSDCNLSPHFIQVPDSNFVDLFRALGVREEVTPKDMEGILATIDSSYQDGAKLSDDDAGLVVRLLETIASFGSSAEYSPDMLILTEESRLCRLSDVVYNNMAEFSGLQEYSVNHIFSSSRISKSVAMQLHIQMLSEKIWNGCNDDFFQNWEQEISIVDSIRQILNDYGPENILNEYLQNAADAGASKFSIMLDHQFYSCDGILNEKMSVGQGPALLIWNNAEFTQPDFEGLRKMAMGSKRRDPEKIGRHGLGFNTAYHLTDLPSVVSGRHIVIFDPKRAYLPKRQTMKGMASDGAVRIDFIDSQLAQKFPGQVAPFQGHFVKVLIKRWAEDAKVSLLFLKHVNALSLIDEAEIWNVQKESESLPDATSPQSDFCKVRIQASEPPGVQLLAISTWLVGVDNDFSAATSTIHEVAQSNRWIPHRGIALPLNLPKEERGPAFHGKVFTYLPTPITSGLPFHIHGVFALTSNRNSLVTSAAYSSHAAEWNKYMLSTLLPPLLVQTMARLLRLKFDSLDTHQSKSGTEGAFHLLLTAYFKLWPLQSTGDMTPMVQTFWEMAFRSPIFPVRPFRKDKSSPMVEGFSGKDVCFPMREMVPFDVLPKLQRMLRENDIPLCECVPEVSSSAQYHWDAASLMMIQTDAGLIRTNLRRNSAFMHWITTADGRTWFLELLLDFLLNRDQDGMDHLNGLALLPLEDGTWASLSPSPEYYTADATARSLLGTHRNLVKESVFSTPKLQKILRCLERDPRYGVAPLPPSKFSEYICDDHGEAIPSPMVPKIWRYIRDCGDLSGYADLPILTTIWGSRVALRSCQGALRVSDNERMDLELMLQQLGPVLQNAGIVIFRPNANERHEYLESKSDPCTNVSVVRALVNSIVTLSSTTFDTDQAAALRRVITNDGQHFTNANMSDLGHLKIWPSYGIGQGGSRLICALGNQMIEGGFNIQNLGDNPNMINCEHSDIFMRMGAHTVSLTDFTRNRVIPRLLSQLINPHAFNGHMEAYLLLLRNLMYIARGSSSLRNDALSLLQSGYLILARDGSLHPSSELSDPEDALLNTVYGQGNQGQGRFPHVNVWNELQSMSAAVSNFRRSSQDSVLVECAQTVLEETVRHPYAPATMQMARTLVQQIYNRPTATDWMQPKWKVVPLTPSLPEPYASSAPPVPAFASFAELVYQSARDTVWTQYSFFPTDLEPTQSFKNTYLAVGNVGVSGVVSHLHVLAKDLARTWSSDSDQLSLQLALLNTYEVLNNYAAESEEKAASLNRLLTATMTVPYIYNGFGKEMHDLETWYWPRRLILDVDNPTETHHLVHSKLQKYRSFLVAAGVCELHSVEGYVTVAPPPKSGEFETLLCNLFESQDRSNGFMDVCFRFQSQDGQDIFAHKIVLAHRSEYFNTLFLGVWAKHAKRDPQDPTLEVISMSGKRCYAAFWGILHYLYSYNLTSLNGPPASSQESTAESEAVRDRLSERVEYLVSLLPLADEYQITRLKDLIASELVVGQMIRHSNVFDVREYADRAQCRPVVEHCEKYVKKNAQSLRSYLSGEIAELQRELHESGRDPAAIRERLAEHEKYREAITTIERS
ncbi:hypothetical protein BG000_001932 [Podila horticola]|nr:hypothetical protein BG000_001932 [Podila horticola]